MSEKKSAVAKKAKEWLLHADEDLQLAKHAFKLKTSAPFKLIAYHAQQCAEKCLAQPTNGKIEPAGSKELRDLGS
jgi:HEPN domain-containing protein